VVDLPPGTGDVVLTALGALPIDGVVLVTTPYPTSVGDTSRSAALFEEGVPVLGTAVNMCGFTCECGREHDLFPEGDPAEALDQPVLAELPFDDAIRDTDGPLPAPSRNSPEKSSSDSRTVPRSSRPTPSTCEGFRRRSAGSRPARSSWRSIPARRST
jgi:hypothetical protein